MYVFCGNVLYVFCEWLTYSHISVMEYITLAVEISDLL